MFSKGHIDYFISVYKSSTPGNYKFLDLLGNKASLSLCCELSVSPQLVENDRET